MSNTSKPDKSSFTAAGKESNVGQLCVGLFSKSRPIQVLDLSNESRIDWDEGAEVGVRVLRRLQRSRCLTEMVIEYSGVDLCF